MKNRKSVAVDPAYYSEHGARIYGVVNRKAVVVQRNNVADLKSRSLECVESRQGRSERSPYRYDAGPKERAAVLHDPQYSHLPRVGAPQLRQLEALGVSGT